MLSTPGFRHGLKQCFFKYSRFFLASLSSFHCFVTFFVGLGNPVRQMSQRVLGVALTGAATSGQVSHEFWGLNIGDPMAFLATWDHGWVCLKIWDGSTLKSNILSMIYHHILYIWLVVTGTWLDYDFPYIGNNNHPNWRTHIFRGIETTNQIYQINHLFPIEMVNPSHIFRAPNPKKSWQCIHIIARYPHEYPIKPAFRMVEFRISLWKWAMAFLVQVYRSACHRIMPLRSSLGCWDRKTPWVVLLNLQPSSRGANPFNFVECLGFQEF